VIAVDSHKRENIGVGIWKPFFPDVDFSLATLNSGNGPPRATHI